MESHAEFLRQITLKEDEVAALRGDYKSYPWSEADRVMLDFVAQLTRDASRLGPANVVYLRAAGFDDRAILQITMIAAWFCYVNRVADALGVGREDL